MTCTQRKVLCALSWLAVTDCVQCAQWLLYDLGARGEGFHHWKNNAECDCIFPKNGLNYF